MPQARLEIPGNLIGNAIRHQEHNQDRAADANGRAPNGDDERITTKGHAACARRCSLGRKLLAVACQEARPGLWLISVTGQWNSVLDVATEGFVFNDGPL
jgi:hypothetical protein